MLVHLFKLPLIKSLVTSHLFCTYPISTQGELPCFVLFFMLSLSALGTKAETKGLCKFTLFFVYSYTLANPIQKPWLLMEIYVAVTRFQSLLAENKTQYENIVFLFFLLEVKVWCWTSCQIFWSYSLNSSAHDFGWVRMQIFRIFIPTRRWGAKPIFFSFPLPSIKSKGNVRLSQPIFFLRSWIMPRNVSVFSTSKLRILRLAIMVLSISPMTTRRRKKTAFCLFELL